MSRRSENVKAWRKRTKSRMVSSFGAECGRCKNQFPPELYDFHHLDPSTKKFNLGAVRASARSWSSIVEELKKCVMLCANCHRGVETGLYSIPKDAKRFDEFYTEYKAPILGTYAEHNCPVCGSDKVLRNNTYCSNKCSGIAKRKKKNRPSAEELKKMVKSKGWEGTGRMFGVTGNAVRKWINKK